MAGYITLPSNGKDFPENTNSTYTVRLSKRIKLNSQQHEVGLKDIIFPSTWKNVPTGKVTNTIFDGSGSEKIEYQVRKGYYSSHCDLVSELHRSFASYGKEKDIRLYHDKIRNTTILKILDAGMNLRFSEDLATIFGLDPKKSYTIGKYESMYAPDINKGFTSLWVYSNLASARHVGDVMAPLLRVIPVKTDAKYTDNYVEFINTHYITASDFDSDLIKVLIRRDNGEEIPFTTGKVVLTVDIRERSN